MKIYSNPCNLGKTAPLFRDVNCKKCNTKLGWIYEFATEDQQKYKEGKVILERALVTEMDGLDGDLGPDDSNE